LSHLCFHNGGVPAGQHPIKAAHAAAERKQHQPEDCKVLDTCVEPCSTVPKPLAILQWKLHSSWCMKITIIANDDTESDNLTFVSLLVAMISASMLQVLLEHASSNPLL
jgi:hypothetical protein